MDREFTWHDDISYFSKLLVVSTLDPHPFMLSKILNFIMNEALYANIWRTSQIPPINVTASVQSSFAKKKKKGFPISHFTSPLSNRAKSALSRQ